MLGKGGLLGLGLRLGALLADGLGLIARTPAPGDARAHALSLTETGAARLPQIVAAVKAHDRAVLGDLSSEEAATLMRLLARLALSS